MKAAALTLASSEARPLQVGDKVRASPLWRRRFNDCQHVVVKHGSRIELTARPWSGTIAAFFTDRDGQRCAVIGHELEDCGCNWNPLCWRCEGTGGTYRRALPLDEIEAA